MSFNAVRPFLLVALFVAACDSDRGNEFADGGGLKKSEADAGMRPSPDSAGEPMVDSGAWPDAHLQIDAAPSRPDAGFQQDAAAVDAGVSAEQRCRQTFNQVEPYEDIDTLLPSESRRTLQAWMASDYLRLYVMAEMPNDLNSSWWSKDMFVLTRNSTTGPFQQASRLNLDVANLFGNETNESGFSYVAGLDRYWYVEGTVEGAASREVHMIMSVRMPDPAQPEAFDDFQVEHLNLSEVDRDAELKGPALTPDALTMIAAKKVAGPERYDLYQFRRTRSDDVFDEGQALTVNSTSASDQSPWLSDDGLQLVFQTKRAGQFDLACAWRESVSESFQGQVLFDGINVSSDSTHEVSPFMLDGNLYFIRVYFQGNGRTELVRASP